MLVWKRKFGQSITIAEEITITVVGIGSNGVCIGVNAPADIPVRRTERTRDSEAAADSTRNRSSEELQTV